MQLTERQFEAAMEHSAIGTALVGLDGQWLWSNKALRDLLGYSADELKTMTFQDVTHPDDLQSDMSHVGELIDGRRPAYQMDKRYIRRDGSHVWIQLTAAVVRAEDGTAQYFISQIQDITQKRADLADRLALAERLSLATAAGGVGVWEWDFGTGGLIWDARMAQIYGLAQDAPVGLADFFDALHPEDVDEVVGAIEAAKRGQRPYNIQFRILGADGQAKHIQALATVVRDVGGAPVRMIGTNWDITEKRRLLHKAEAASEAKSQFLAAMSHEIRTPLNGVLGMAQAMACEAMSPSQHERLQIIQDSGNVLLQILNDILDLTKVEAGKLELESIPFALGALLQGVQATFAAIARDKDLDLQLDLADAPGVYRGDPTRLRQVLTNFVSNALKFTSAGHVRLAARRVPGGVELSVSDTGAGIAEDLHDRIFASFAQADVSTTRTHGGTGLGLSICRHLAELMGGEIRLESTLGAGAAFIVTLPLERLGEETAAKPAPHSAAESGAMPLKVLVAEDNEVNQLVLKALLAQVGVEPHIVNHGQAAVDAWAADAWDLILMDVRMPVLDGIGATRAIREAEGRLGRPRTCIVALTANAMPHHLAEYAEVGMDDFVAKPIEARALFAALQRAIRAAPPQEGCGQAA